MQRFLLETSDFGKNIEENLNTVVTDKKCNNRIVCHMLDLTNANIFDIPNPLEVTLKDIKKFDAENPVIGNLLSQIEASKLTGEKTKKYLANTLSTKDIELKDGLDEL